MIELSRVCKTYETGSKAVKDISLTIDDGEFVFIVGRSGSGKSTLMKLLLKELEPTKGRIVVNDMDLGRMPRRYIPKYRRRLGVVFQDFRLQKDRTVFENVAFAQRVVEADYKTMKRRVMEVLNQVGLGSKAKYYPDQLSGGEKQRTAIARAIVNRPVLLLADEPTGNLDQKNAEDIMRLLERINGQGTTVLVVSHNQELVRSMHRRQVVLRRGQVARDLAREAAAYGY